MSSVNKVTLLGRVGKDPEIRSMQSGDEVASFSIATSESWKDKLGEKKERTEWTQVVVFNQPLIKVIRNYVSKGSQVYIEGSLETRKWDDKDGNTRYVTEVVMRPFNSSLVLLGSKNEKGDERGFSDASDDIPFAPIGGLI